MLRSGISEESPAVAGSGWCKPARMGVATAFGLAGRMFAEHRACDSAPKHSTHSANRRADRDKENFRVRL
jgi:hypothetical protein